MKYNTFTWWLQAWRRDGAIVHMKSFNTWCISICNAIIFELHDFLPTIQLSSGICQNTTREAESLAKPELQNTSCYSCCQCCILIIKSEIRIQMRQSDRKQPGRGSRLLLSSHLEKQLLKLQLQLQFSVLPVQHFKQSLKQQALWNYFAAIYLTKLDCLRDNDWKMSSLNI